LEHDLAGKPENHPRIKSEGKLFRIMLSKQKRRGRPRRFVFRLLSAWR
jgi:hypothetical protein